MSTTLSDHRPRARKQHRCSDCGRSIHPGERYRRAVIVGDDGVYSWLSCGHCDQVSDHVWRIEAPYQDEGIDLLEWLGDNGHLEIATLMRNHWRTPGSTELVQFPYWLLDVTRTSSSA